jgi:hypothetical protein
VFSQSIADRIAKKTAQLLKKAGNAKGQHSDHQLNTSTNKSAGESHRQTGA